MNTISFALQKRVVLVEVAAACCLVEEEEGGPEDVVHCTPLLLFLTRFSPWPGTDSK